MGGRIDPPRNGRCASRQQWELPSAWLNVTAGTMCKRGAAIASFVTP